MPQYEVDMSSDKEKQLKAYLSERVRTMMQSLKERRELYDEIDDLLEAKAPYETLEYDDCSETVTPVTQTRVEGVSDRIQDAFWTTKPVARINNITGVKTPEEDHHALSREATDMFDWAARNPRVLNAENVSDLVVRDMTRYGLGAFKVVKHIDQLKSGTYDPEKGKWVADKENITVYTGPRWFYVSARDLVWLDGYGQDVDEQRIIGHVTKKTWSNMQGLVNLGVYDPKAIEEIKSYKSQSDPNESMDSTMERDDYDVLHLWLSYDIDGDGIDEHLLIDYHIETETILRTSFYPFRRRPMFVVRLRSKRGTSFNGMGIPELLKATQTQIDHINNLVIDASKAGSKYLFLAKLGTKLADLISDEDITPGPGDRFVTGNPREDGNTMPMGDPNVARLLIPIAESFRRDANDLVGIGPAQLGDLGAAHRAAFGSIDALLREGLTFTRGASRRYAQVFSEAVIHTFEIWRRIGGSNNLTYQVLGEDGQWVEKMFAWPENLRDTWGVNIAIASPENSPESMVQRNLMLGQFILSWLEKMTQVVMAVGNPEVPEAVKVGFTHLAGVSELVITRIMEHAKDMQDLTVLLPHLRDMLPVIQKISADQQAEEQQALMQQLRGSAEDLQAGIATARGGQRGRQQ